VVYTDDGVRKHFSTGTKSKIQAKNYCLELLKKDKLMPRKSVKFADYAKGWFDYDTSIYIQSRLSKGFSYSRSYADHQQQALDDNIIPHFGKVLITHITVLMIEKWIIQLKQEGFSNATANRFFNHLRTILAEAHRRGDIDTNPAAAVQHLAHDSQVKGVFTQEEAEKLTCDAAKRTVWEETNLYYLFNKTASVTGMRFGELQALILENVYKDHIVVKHSWDRTYGLKGTKTGKDRVVPISHELYQELITQAKGHTAGPFVFSCDKGKQPVDHKAIQKHFSRALRAIGISEKERKERHLSFHSWRHYVNTQLRLRGVPDSVVQAITGHSTNRMTEHYTHYSAADLTRLLQEGQVTQDGTEDKEAENENGGN
jgi:integrase